MLLKLLLHSVEQERKKNGWSTFPQKNYRIVFFYYLGGFYLFLNYTTDKTKDNRALLVSPPISSFAHEQRCLRFWYFMNGMDKDCAILRVKVHGADDRLSEAVWSQHGDVRNAWKEASINLNGRSRPFQVLIKKLEMP